MIMVESDSKNERDDVPTQTGGPIDGNVWPSRLTARVVDPGLPARIHGYEVEADLAVHYRYTDLVLLALIGELPPAPTSQAFDMVLQFLAPLDVTSAPTHTAVLSRLCGAQTSASIGVTALALAEHARYIVAEHADWLAWLDAPSAALPAVFAVTSKDDRRIAEDLRVRVRDVGLDVPALAQFPTRTAALLAILHACGLRRAEQIEAAIVMARMPCALAESFAMSAGHFQNYPMRLPPFFHEEVP